MTDVWKTASFDPDWVSAPGETIEDILKEKNMSLLAFSQRLGFTLAQIDDLLDGTMKITTALAVKLEKLLGAPATFWMIREAQYRTGLAEGCIDVAKERRR